MDYRENLKTYLDHKKIKPAVFVKELNFSNGLINKVLKKEAQLSIDKLSMLFEYLEDLNVRWLFTGKGEMLLKRTEDIDGVSYKDKAEWYADEYLKKDYENIGMKVRIEELEAELKVCREGK